MRYKYSIYISHTFLTKRKISTSSHRAELKFAFRLLKKNKKKTGIILGEFKVKGYGRYSQYSVVPAENLFLTME